jgi:hypothetical protein
MFFGQRAVAADRRVQQTLLGNANEGRRIRRRRGRMYIERTTMSDSEMMRPRSGDQWVPRRSSTPTISVTVTDTDSRRLPFGFGIREEEPEAVLEAPEWEGNPS